MTETMEIVKIVELTEPTEIADGGISPKKQDPHCGKCLCVSVDHKCFKIPRSSILTIVYCRFENQKCLICGSNVCVECYSKHLRGCRGKTP